VKKGEIGGEGWVERGKEQGIQDFLSHYLYDQETRRIAGRQGPLDGALLPLTRFKYGTRFRFKILTLMVASVRHSNSSPRPPLAIGCLVGAILPRSASL